MAIRNAAKALVLHEGKLLLVRCENKRHGEHYTLPGGGQNQYETMEEAVVREVKEETGYKVSPLRLAAIGEEIDLREDMRERYPDYAHRIFHVFACALADEVRGMATEMDMGQQGAEWVELEKLAALKILPALFAKNMARVLRDEAPVNLGVELIE